MDELVYFIFTNGANWHTRNLGSVAWVICYPTAKLMVSRGVFIDSTSNNIVEYTTIINLLFGAISYGIDSFVVYLDSQLVVSQLNNIYWIQDPYLYHQFLIVRVVQRSFVFITYLYIPRFNNSLVDSIAIQALDWHIIHSSR